MVLKRDQQEERLARLEALMEEYRVKNEQTQQKVADPRKGTARAAAPAKAMLEKAKRRKKKP